MRTYRHWEHVDRICERCGISYKPERYVKKTRFCSNKCRSEALVQLSKNLPRCDKCGRMTSRIHKHDCASIEVRYPNGKFCKKCGRKMRLYKIMERQRFSCISCYKREVSIRRRGIRRKLIMQFGGACQRCGYHRFEGALEFHHINGRMDNEYKWRKSGPVNLREVIDHPERFNLFCSNCHKEVEYSKVHSPTLMPPQTISSRDF